MPDPKLKAAMEEVKGILEKYDIAGSVLLSSPANIEFLRSFKTSWTAAWIESDGCLRIRCKQADYATREDWVKIMTATVGLFAGLVDAHRNETEQLTRVLAMLAEKVDFDHMTKEEPPDAV